MKKVTIYTNGQQFFTLENFDKAAGVCHALNITIHDEVSQLKARAMHTNGQLHYVFGTGDRKALTEGTLKRGVMLGDFNVR